MEPNTKLFPAVFVHPTSANLFQFEFVKVKVRLFFLALSEKKNESINIIQLTLEDRQ